MADPLTQYLTTADGRTLCYADWGAAPSGNPGPLVANFCGNDAGRLPCPVMLIPGSLSDERLETLS